MLSDHERKALCEVERQLLAEDPEFAGSFHARERRLGRGRLQPAAEIVIVVGVLLSALMLVAGSPSGALAFAAAAAVIWVSWRYFAETSRRAP